MKVWLPLAATELVSILIIHFRKAVTGSWLQALSVIKEWVRQKWRSYVGVFIKYNYVFYDKDRQNLLWWNSLFCTEFSCSLTHLNYHNYTVVPKSPLNISHSFSFYLQSRIKKIRTNLNRVTCIVHQIVANFTLSSIYYSFRNSESIDRHINTLGIS